MLDDDSANENMLRMNRICALVIVIASAVHSLCKTTFGEFIYMLEFKASAMLILFKYAQSALCGYKHPLSRMVTTH